MNTKNNSNEAANFILRPPYVNLFEGLEFDPDDEIQKLEEVQQKNDAIAKRIVEKFKTKYGVKKRYQEMGVSECSRAVAFAKSPECLAEIKKFREDLLNKLKKIEHNRENERSGETDKDSPATKRRKVDDSSLPENVNETKSEISTPNTQYPSFIENLSIELVPGMNRGLITNSELDVGTIVIADRPFASILQKTSLPHCLTCHTFGGELMPCENCTTALFCNSDCQKRNLAHRFECGTQFQLIEFKSLHVKCAIQMVLEALALFPSFEELQQYVEKMNLDANELPNSSDSKLTKFNCIMALRPHFYEGYVNDVMAAYNILWSYTRFKMYFELDVTNRHFLQHLIARFLGVLRLNGFTFQAEVNRGEIIDGIDVYGPVSFLNHSCSPNLITHLSGNKMIATTCRKVEQGSQLFIDYYNLDNDRERKKSLWEDFHFECQCDRCQSKPNSIKRTDSMKVDRYPKSLVENQLKKCSPTGWTSEIGALIIRYQDVWGRYFEDSGKLVA